MQVQKRHKNQSFRALQAILFNQPLSLIYYSSLFKKGTLFKKKKTTMTKTKQIICALLFIFQYANAQKITELIQQDTMIHVYKLNDEQVKFALREYTIRDSDFLFTKPFREYPIKKYKTDTLPVGNFLIASITNNIVNNVSNATT
jgi:hypothetical protein